MELQRSNLNAAVLLADVVGSTPLYESVGNDIALGQIADWRERMCSLVHSNGGEYISSKGDDVLSLFSDPAGAFRAAAQMMVPTSLPIPFHAGLHFGPIIRVGDDIYGDAVNLTARLAAIANPGEVLITQSLVDRLSPVDRELLGFLDKMVFKGKSEPCSIYAFLDRDRSLNTQISNSRLGKSAVLSKAIRPLCITLRYNDQAISCHDNEALTIGRSPDCRVVINRQWVSRHHATITIENGRIRLAERSSSGTFISMQQGQEFMVRRENVLLLGSGTISPGMRCTGRDAQIVYFDIGMV